MKRAAAEALIDEVRAMLASRTAPEKIERRLALAYRLPPLTACDGAAHENPHIDHCGRCAPRWGLVGAREKIDR